MNDTVDADYLFEISWSPRNGDAVDIHVICLKYPAFRGMEHAVDIHVICLKYPAFRGMEDAVDIDIICWNIRASKAWTAPLML